MVGLEDPEGLFRTVLVNARLREILSRGQKAPNAATCMRNAVEEAEHGRGNARQDHVRHQVQHLDGIGLHVLLPLACRAPPP